MNWASRLAQRFGLARSLALVLLLLLAVLRVVDPSPLHGLRVRTFDFFQTLHPREAKQRPVVIVDIDEKSLKSVGQWPWPRTRIADLVSRLEENLRLYEAGRASRTPWRDEDVGDVSAAAPDAIRAAVAR